MTLDPQALSLPPQGAAEIAQLVLDYIVDRLLRLTKIVADVLSNLVARYPVP